MLSYDGVVEEQRLPRFARNDNVEIAEHQDILPRVVGVTILDTDNLSTAESVLSAWATSEIYQSLAYIKYESDSEYVSNINLMHKNFKNWIKDSVRDDRAAVRDDNIGAVIASEAGQSRFKDIHNGRVMLLPDGTEIIRSFEYLTELMAILNYTSDSFSDGGKYNQIDKALTQIISQVELGAAIVDLGVESTRPGATAMSDQEEIKLLSQILGPIIELKQQYNFRLSIDTYHPETVLWLLNMDIDIVNDVSGNLPLELIAAIIKNNQRYIAMHSLGIPASRTNIIDIAVDPIQAINSFMENKVKQLLAIGVKPENIEKSLIFDPGIGFGKNPAQSWYILNNLNKLNTHGCELLIGHSRKSFFSHIADKSAANRDLETAIVAAQLINKVDYIRLHDLTMQNAIYPTISSFNFRINQLQ